MYIGKLKAPSDSSLMVVSVAEFLIACDHHVYSPANNAMYGSFIASETYELVRAVAEFDIVEVLDGACDVDWVTIGYELTRSHMEYSEMQLTGRAIWRRFMFDYCKISEEISNEIYLKAWAEVTRSNMAKISPCGKVLKNEHGKVQKPEGWTPPDLRSILLQYPELTMSLKV